MTTSKKVKKCEYCGNEFEYVRKSKRFCSPSCRVTSHQQTELNERKLRDAMFAINDVAIRIRMKPGTIDKNTERQIITLKNALDALEEQFWSSVSKMHTGHGGQVYRHCEKCGQIVFGWEDDFPAKCDFCGKLTNWLTTEVAKSLGIYEG